MDLHSAANTPSAKTFGLEAATFKPTAFKPSVPPLRVGIDVGSTTVKFVALDENDTVCYSDYQRHLADIRGTINGSLDAQYRKFQRKLVTDFHKWQAGILRE